MANFCILRIKKLHTNSNVGGAVSHHLRTRETDNADPERIAKNWYYPNFLNEPIEDLSVRKEIQRKSMADYKRLLPQKIRKNAVRCVEFMMTVSPEVMQRKDFNAKDYLKDCGEFVQNKFGMKNVFFMAQHLDETTPHISVLMTPIDENGKLNARKFFGDRNKLSQLQTDFAQEVGAKYGLDRGIKGSKAHHKTIKQYYTELNDFDHKIDNVAQQIYNDIPKKKPLLQSESDYNFDIKKAIFHVIKPLSLDSWKYQDTKNQLDEVKMVLTSTQKNYDSLQKNIDFEKRIATFEAKQEVSQELKTQEEQISELKRALDEARAETTQAQKEFREFKNNPKAMKKRISDLDISVEM